VADFDFIHRGATTLILALDTSTTACTAALIGADGTVHARRDDRIGRGHAEHLAPMIADMLDGHVPREVLVGVGPGSFTGLRIGIAAAHGLAIGWDVPVRGFNSLALMAVEANGDDPVAVAVTGGHGELFVQEFARRPFAARGPVMNLPPAEAAAAIEARFVVGSGAEALVAAMGHGEAVPMLPAAAHVLRLPLALRTLAPSPVYARAPDAKPKQAA
jgi:tRNA threonylcarbamoyladenosine biosynthesis protein TsaB